MSAVARLSSHLHTLFEAQGTSKRAMTWIGIALCGLTVIPCMASCYNNTVVG
jgi:hypothetical protein